MPALDARFMPGDKVILFGLDWSGLTGVVIGVMLPSGWDSNVLIQLDVARPDMSDFPNLLHAPVYWPRNDLFKYPEEEQEYNNRILAHELNK